MSIYRIYYNKGAKKMAPISTLEEYHALRDSKENLALLNAARNGNKLAKSKLLQCNYSCYPTEDGKLKGASIPSHSVGMDIDIDPDREDYEDFMKAIPGVVKDRANEIGLLMLERSVTKGYHLVFKRDPNLTQVENLERVSQILGVNYDKGAKDITRVFFTTSNDDLLYLNEEIFADNTPSAEQVAQAREELQKSIEELRETRDIKQEPDDLKDEDENMPLHDVMLKVLPNACYDNFVNGHSIADIIENYFVLFNNGHAPQKGNRNSMTFELAKALRCIVDYRLEKLKEYIPRFSNFDEKEWEITLQNANNEPKKGMNYRMQKVLQSLEEIQPVDEKSSNGLKSELPPEMPTKLPYPLNVLSSKVPFYYRAAVCEGVFPALGAHLHGVRFRYWDNVEHEATFMNLLVAPMSVGKGSIRKPIAFILDDLMKRDAQSRLREAEWKLSNQGKNKKATPRPDDICIQVLIDNLTDAVFNQRVTDAHRNGERYLFTQCDELDTLKQLTSKGTPEQVSIIIRKAFDNSLHGQERVGAESVTGIAPLRFNFNASTTIPNCRRFFYRGVNDGTITRLSLSTIIKPVDAPRPKFAEYDDDYKMVVRKIVECLDRKVGTYHSEKCEKFILKLLDENEELSDIYGSESYLVLSYRATVIAFLKGMVLYLLNNERWTKDIEEYVRWSLRYDLWCKMRIFGNQLESEIEEEQENSNSVRQNNLLNLLPQEFSLSEMKSLRKPNGSTIKNASDLLKKWINRGYVKQDESTGLIRKCIKQ